MLTKTDLESLEQRGISRQMLDRQLEKFNTGFPFLKLAGSATIGNGIVKLDGAQQQKAVERWKKYLTDGGSVAKFVPASGAASRMFKALFGFVNGNDDKPAPGSPVEQLLDNLDKLPFIKELDNVLAANTGKTAADLKAAGQYKDIIAAIVNEDGMNYGQLPKGLLSFHRYGTDSVRTPLEEQMVEGAQTAAVNGKVNMHFTVSSNHRKLFEDKIAAVQPGIEQATGVKFDISLSEQKPSTDTVAVTPDNKPFRDDRGRLVFRPGGHGALIENLNDMDATVVFVKNIDNVVPDSQRASTIQYKQVLAGLLIEAHDDIEGYLRDINAGAGRATLDEILGFVQTVLSTVIPGAGDMDDVTLARVLKGKLDRPLRVCGMVVNEGEPGGGPYLAYNADGSYSPQILESTQIDTSDPQAAGMMARATHFNPVDLVCYLRDTDGEKFDLREYVDENTGFISEKSAFGRDLRALELPGLWNGAMSDWSTIFVEVPASTFNPVKTVNDLLRPVHQS